MTGQTTQSRMSPDPNVDVDVSVSVDGDVLGFFRTGSSTSPSPFTSTFTTTFTSTKMIHDRCEIV